MGLFHYGRELSQQLYLLPVVCNVIKCVQKGGGGGGFISLYEFILIGTFCGQMLSVSTVKRLSKSENQSDQRVAVVQRAKMHVVLFLFLIGWKM